MTGSKKITGFILVMLIFISIITISGVEGLSTSGVDITIEGDDNIFVNQSVEYNVKISGIFGNSAENWTLHSNVEGNAEVKPGKIDSNDSNEFTVELIATEPGDFKITFKGYCSNGDEVRYKEESI
ncbi:MAG: hypothetical protein ACOC85_04960, partial [Thermoplasmatota archaeon]